MSTRSHAFYGLAKASTEKAEHKPPLKPIGLKFSLCLLLLGTFSCSPFSVPDLASNALTAYLTGRVARDVINEAKEAAHSLLVDARTGGDALAARVANELNVAAENAVALLGKEIDRQVSDLEEIGKLAIIKVDRLRIAVKDFEKGAFDLKDAAALDLRDLADEVLPYARTDFFVQKVHGLTLAHGMAEYRIIIHGIGFGPDSDKRKNKIIDVKVGGRSIPNFRTHRNVAHVSELVLGNAAVAKHFALNPKRPVLVPLEIHVEVQRKGGILFDSWAAHDYVLPLEIVLMPSQIAEVTVEYAFLKEKKWEIVSPKRMHRCTTPDRHEMHRIDFACEKVRLAGNQRFAKPIGARKEGEGAPWADDPRVDILEDGKVLAATVLVWGRPFQVFFWAAVEEERVVYENGTKSAGIESGGNFEVIIPNDARLLGIKGETVTFAKIELAPGQSNDILEYIGTFANGLDQRIVYRVLAP